MVIGWIRQYLITLSHLTFWVYIVDDPRVLTFSPDFSDKLKASNTSCPKLTSCSSGFHMPPTLATPTPPKRLHLRCHLRCFILSSWSPLVFPDTGLTDRSDGRILKKNLALWGRHTSPAVCEAFALRLLFAPALLTHLLLSLAHSPSPLTPTPNISSS